jgi:hypothetical protein
VADIERVVQLRCRLATGSITEEPGQSRRIGCGGGRAQRGIWEDWPTRNVTWEPAPNNTTRILGEKEGSQAVHGGSPKPSRSHSSASGNVVTALLSVNMLLDDGGSGDEEGRQ